MPLLNMTDSLLPEISFVLPKLGTYKLLFYYLSKQEVLCRNPIPSSCIAGKYSGKEKLWLTFGTKREKYIICDNDLNYF